MPLADEVFMREALKQARGGFDRDEVPVGAVIVQKGRIIARAYNQVEMLKDPTGHAELLAITSAANLFKCKWLTDCSLYVTIEPCSMCAGALVLARIKRICFGAYDPKSGACGSVMNIVGNRRLNHRIEVAGGCLEEECGNLVSEFFRRKRQMGANKITFN